MYMASLLLQTRESWSIFESKITNHEWIHMDMQLKIDRYDIWLHWFISFCSASILTSIFSCRRQTYLPKWYVNVSTCTQPAAAACYCCWSSRLVLSCRWNPCLSHKISSANAMFTSANTWMITTQSLTLLTRFHISVHAAPFCVNHLMLFHCFSEITPLAHDVKLETVKIRIWVSEGFFIGQNRRTHKTK